MERRASSVPERVAEWEARADAARSRSRTPARNQLFAGPAALQGAKSRRSREFLYGARVRAARLTGRQLVL